MGIREQCPPRRQSINVRGLHQRVPTEAADPVVLVINGDEEDVRATRGLSSVADPDSHHTQQANQHK